MNKKLLLIIFIVGALCCSYAATPLVPQKPQPDIRDGDRLYASWLNGMFGTIYNWAQNQQIETDKLLHNGAGVASLTATLMKALGEIETPLIHVDGRNSAPATPKTDDGYIFFDKNTKRFMGYQEGQWRDLSPVTIVDGSDLSSPLIVGGYLKADNTYTDNIKIGSTDKAHNEISSQTATINIGSTGAIKLPTATDLNKLNTTLGTGSIAYNPTTKKLYVYDGTNWVSPTVDITVDSEISSTSTNPVQNKKVVEYVGANLQSAMSYADTQDATTLASAKSYADTKDATTLASAKSYTDTKTSGLSVTVDASMSSTSTNAVQNKVIKKYVDDNKVTVDSAMNNGSVNPVQNKVVMTYVADQCSNTLIRAEEAMDAKDTAILNSAKSYTDANTDNGNILIVHDYVLCSIYIPNGTTTQYHPVQGPLWANITLYLNKLYVNGVKKYNIFKLEMRFQKTVDVGTSLSVSSTLDHWPLYFNLDIYIDNYIDINNGTADYLKPMHTSVYYDYYQPLRNNIESFETTTWNTMKFSKSTTDTKHSFIFEIDAAHDYNNQRFYGVRGFDMYFTN